MDKTYLIHNIEISDNPANGHQTMDIELKNLSAAGGDITADITIVHNAAGSDPEIDSYEGVSLTGAGGGGGGDFSTAAVTIIAMGDMPTIGGAFILDVPEYQLLGTYASSQGLTSPLQMVLYKGSAFISGLAESDLLSTSGNITYDRNAGMWKVTGDCEITIRDIS